MSCPLIVPSYRELADQVDNQTPTKSDQGQAPAVRLARPGEAIRRFIREQRFSGELQAHGAVLRRWAVSLVLGTLQRKAGKVVPSRQLNALSCLRRCGDVYLRANFHYEFIEHLSIGDVADCVAFDRIRDAARVNAKGHSLALMAGD